MPDKKVEIWDCQEFVRTAPLKEVMEFVWWAQGVIDVRELMEAQPKRKKRSDAGQSRTLDLQEPKK
jgi:hypothetical protein